MDRPKTTKKVKINREFRDEMREFLVSIMHKLSREEQSQIIHINTFLLSMEPL